MSKKMPAFSAKKQKKAQGCRRHCRIAFLVNRKDRRECGEKRDCSRLSYNPSDLGIWGIKSVADLNFLRIFILLGRRNTFGPVVSLDETEAFDQNREEFEAVRGQ